jgi:chaperone modulatory protein CbpM
MSYNLVRVAPADPYRLDLESFCRAAQVHPDLVLRLVALGLLDPRRDPAGAPWFGPADLFALARIRRLRAGLGVNYAALGLVIDLLDRIADLERQLHQTPSRRTGG